MPRLLPACLALALLLPLGCGRQATAEQRAVMLVDKGRNEEAISVLRQHLLEHPDAVKERRLLIRVIALTGNLEAAAREAEELALRLPDRDPRPLIEMGRVYELAHRYDDALAMYDRAAGLAPTDAAGPREGGLRAARWGEVELAEPRLTEAVRRAPTDARVWHALGVVRAKLGDFAGAEQAYGAGLNADPKALENHIGLATLAVRANDGATALRHYDAVIAARPAFADAYLGRSWALLRLGRLADAQAALDEARRKGADARAAAAQGRLLARLRAAAEGQKNR